MEISPLSAVSWYAQPVSTSAYLVKYGTLYSTHMLYRTLSSMSRPNLAASAVSLDYNTKTFALAFGGSLNTAAVSARAEQGIGTLIDVVA